MARSRTEREITSGFGKAREREPSRPRAAGARAVFQRAAAHLMAGHPVWTLRAALSWLLRRKPLAAARELWTRASRSIEFPSARSLPGSDRGRCCRPGRPIMQWSPELGISGEVHEGLLCGGSSHFTFRTAVGHGARLRAHCALLPRDWDTRERSVEFKASVRARLRRRTERVARAESVDSVERSTLAQARRSRCRRSQAAKPSCPSKRAHGPMPGEPRLLPGAISRSNGRGAPPSASSFVRGAIRRLREWGLRGTLDVRARATPHRRSSGRVRALGQPARARRSSA